MDEIVEKVLSVDIKVQTVSGKQMILCISDITGHIGSSLMIDNGDEDDTVKIELKIECLGYSLERIELPAIPKTEEV